MSSTAHTPSEATPFPWIGLITLAGAIFVSVTSEFLPTGLLPEMAADLDVSLSTVGYLVTIFAATVVVATTPLSILTRRYSRKALVVVVLLVIATANTLSAIAPTYEILVGARILGGLAHGLFWAVVAAYAAHLVPKHQLGRAVAITAGGGSAAFVLGVPVGTALGHALGWRSAFFIIAGIVVVLAVVVIRYLPAVDHRVTLKTGEIAIPVAKDKSFAPVLLLCVVILLMLIGQNVFSTYIAPWLSDVGGVDPDVVPFMLFLFGGAGAIGLVLAGFVGDRFPRRGFVAGVLIVMVSLLVLAIWSGNSIVVVVAYTVWGVAFGGLPAMMQTRMMHTASFRVRDLASALQTTAFNIGIGGGALLGGLLLDGTGLTSLPIAAILFLGTGLIVSVAFDSVRIARARRARPLN
jgi:predicted MFS family arabinose efflux permease